MKTLTELTPQQHQELRIADDCAIQFAQQQNIMNLRVTEVSQAACCMPIFYVRNSQNGQWVLTGFTSFEQGCNLFIDQGQWTALHTPANMQTFPFFLMKSPENPQQYTIGIDEAHSVFSTTSGQPIFETNGKASLHLSRVKTLLEADIKNDIRTQEFSHYINQLGLLRPINILIQQQNGNTPSLSGLYTIDEDKLQSLNKDTLFELHQKGYLAPIQSMLMSLFQLNALIKKHNKIQTLTPIKSIKLEVSKNSTAA
ncbi:SapC family protein [Shewanella inventionis]|uniref:SapC family protein n=1 Tax=Shewanella inventionis TaxID=1738770 RepID=A0ABQ1JER1_9GAMM|nr:SapC family protein [Shewanella inventionis]MCL1158090.1 SapC family protein [Shewanella inventionis]GGB65349.1 SapC family protein [Shewanella inventionis]